MTTETDKDPHPPHADSQSTSPAGQGNNRIAFQGVFGAYSELACRAAHPDMDPLPCPTFVEAIAAVCENRARYAMLPVENSIAGRVADIYYLLPESQLFIIAEHYQPVIHHLLVTPGATTGDIQRVRSHPQALAQCRKYLARHGYTPEAWNDTATAAQDVASIKDKSVAAIASSLAGERYGLTPLDENIADEADNTTRFLTMARAATETPSQAACITTILFKARSVPAALYKALGGFATCGINLTKIESYPVRGHLELAEFYIDVEGHPDTEAMKHALEELSFFSSEIRILGTYPAHPHRNTAK